MAEVRVEIYNQAYVLRGEKSEAQLRRVAREVDYRMSEIATTRRNLDVTRIAVLVALHLAEDHLDLQARYDRVVKMLEDQYAKQQTQEDLMTPMRRDLEQPKKQRPEDKDERGFPTSPRSK